MSRCTVINMANILGKKWTIPLLQEVESNGSKGFNAILRRMKMRPKTLSDRLKELQMNGIVGKDFVKENNVLKTSYHLEDKGKSFMNIITGLKKWNERYNKVGVKCGDRNCIDCPVYL